MNYGRQEGLAREALLDRPYMEVPICRARVTNSSSCTLNDCYLEVKRKSLFVDSNHDIELKSLDHRRVQLNRPMVDWPSDLLSYYHIGECRAHVE